MSNKMSIAIGKISRQDESLMPGGHLIDVLLIDIHLIDDLIIDLHRPESQQYYLQHACLKRIRKASMVKHIILQLVAYNRASIESLHSVK